MEMMALHTSKMISFSRAWEKINEECCIRYVICISDSFKNIIYTFYAIFLVYVKDLTLSNVNNHDIASKININDGRIHEIKISINIYHFSSYLKSLIMLNTICKLINNIY